MLRNTFVAEHDPERALWGERRIDLDGKNYKITERIRFIGQATKGLCTDDLVR